MDTPDTTPQTAPAATPATDADFGSVFGSALTGDPAAAPTPAPASQEAGQATPAAPSGDGDTGGAGGSSADAHSASVYNGRLGRAMRDNNALRSENEKLRAELAKFSRAKADEDLLGLQEAQVLDDESRKAVVALVSKARDEMRSELDEYRRSTEMARESYESAQMRDLAARTQRLTADAVEKQWPGLMHRVGSGDLLDAWRKFCREPDPVTGTTWGESLRSASSRGAVAAAKRVFDEFVATTNLAPQFRVPGSPIPPGGFAAPVRAPAGAAGNMWPSREAILAKMDEVVSSARRGSIDPKTRQAQLAQLEDDLRAGRYLK